MSIQAGFAAADITPPLGTRKIGWLKEIVGDTVRSPLFARIAVFQTHHEANHTEERTAVIQLDTLFIAWPEVAAIRRAVTDRYGFPGDNVMVAATHNHAGPAITHAGDVPKDQAYADDLVNKVVIAFGEALAAVQDADIGFSHTYEWGVAHNRRVVMRDGTVRTHGTFADPDALCLEGPVDPEVAVIGVRSKTGDWLGTLVNFACHPTHHGGDTNFDAGYPGVLARTLGDWGCPMTLFLNGASGNLHTSDPRHGGRGLSATETGERLAQDVQRILDEMTFQDDVSVSSAAQTLNLPYRRPGETERRGRIQGAQRFIDSAIYDRRIPALMAKIEARGGLHRAEVQALALGDQVLISVPGEVFTEIGLQIKTRAYPVHALVVSCANGRVGYIPTPAAFSRGGYETTFGPSSMLAPEAGAMIVDAAVDLIAAVHDAT